MYTEIGIGFGIILTIKIGFVTGFTMGVGFGKSPLKFSSSLGIGVIIGFGIGLIMKIDFGIGLYTGIGIG